jgi:tetratricopeptide (TPR) repeat protein
MSLEARTPAALRQEGLERLRAGALPQAIDLLSRASALAPHDPATQLNLGIALQSAGRHGEAVEFFRTAQASLPDDPGPFLHAAVSLLALAQFEAAARAASDACHRAPDLPQAHYAYGQAWLALGEPDRAEQAFAAAVKLAPRFADAWINYGVARYRQGAIEDAKTAMRQVLSFAPNHPVATSNLAAFLRISGGAEIAEDLLRAQLARQPDDVGARLNLAAELLHEERAAEALQVLDAMAPPREVAAYQHWRLQQALAHLQMNRHAAARQVLQLVGELGPVTPALLPLLHWRLVLLARAEGDRRRAHREADAMEVALAQAGAEAVPEHAIMAHFDLAKFWSGEDRGDRAFAHWTAGHALLKRSQPFSRDAHRAFVDANVAALGASRFRDGARAGNDDRAPVFIVGMPRSGTTLIEQILDAHGEAHGAGERGALGHAFAVLGGGDDAAAVARIAALDQATLDAAAGQYLSALHALAPQAKRVIDKMPGNFNYLGLVGLMLPGAKIIHCARDPRDIGLSIFTFRFHGSHGYAHDLGDLGWYIGEHDRLVAHWKAALPNPILSVHLSDWVTDFDGTLGKVLTHIDLPPDPACARFYERDSRVRTVSRTQVRQPVNARGLGRWRGYEKELGPLIAELDRAGSLAAWRGQTSADPAAD